MSRLTNSNPPEISSPQNPFYRHCLRLRENRKRRKAGQFLIDGATEICRALEAGIVVERVLVSGDHPVPGRLSEALQKNPRVQIQSFSQQLMSKLSYGQQGVSPVALALQPDWNLSGLELSGGGTVLVLDRCEKPGNLGACARSGAACGVAAIVLTRPICDPLNANAIRASRGAIFQLPLAIATPAEVLELAGRIHAPIFAARVGAHQGLWQLPLQRGGFLVFGNETHGLEDCWRHPSVQDFTIPMASGVDSLNLSISAAVTMYEAFRQKRLAEFDPLAERV